MMAKIVIVGDEATGKTHIIKRFVNDKIDKDTISPTISVDFFTKFLRVENTTVKMHVWDTVGQERFRSLTSAYYKNAHGVVLVFDLTFKQSFLNLTSWLKEIKTNCEKTSVCILLGNKMDLTDKIEVTQEEIAEFTKNNNLIYMPVSAIDMESTSVRDSMQELVKQIVKVNNDVKNNPNPAARSDTVKKGRLRDSTKEIIDRIEGNSKIQARKGCC